jgi:hypothetical protein
MDWWISGALGVVVLILIAIYRRSLRETRFIAHYLLLILLDEEVYAVQRKALANFVRATDAKNAAELGGKTYDGTCQLAEKLSIDMLAVNRLLWKLKTDAASSQSQTARPLPGFIDIPSRFDTLANWERHLRVVEALPENTLTREEMIKEARQMIAEKRAIH